MLPNKADFVIIGAGIIGCSIAFNLAKLGAKNVIVLEKEKMTGMGSTAKCSGGIRQQFASPANILLSMESVKIFKNWQEQFPYPVGYNLDFRQTGYLFLLHSSSRQIQNFLERISVQKSLGVNDVDFVKCGKLSADFPYLNLQDIAVGVFCPSDGVADPASARAEYERQAKMLGVRIFTGVKVLDIGANLDFMGLKKRKVEIVFTDKGPILTPCVISAAGPHANQIGKMLDIEIPVIPHRHQTIATSPVRWIKKNDPLVIDYDDYTGEEFYFRPEAGNENTGCQMLLGGYKNGKIEIADPDKYKEQIDFDFLYYLAEKAIDRFEKGEEIKILPKSGIAGLYESTPDALPILGKTQKAEGFIMANGFSGHGFMHSPIIGKIIADIAFFGASSFDNMGLGLDDFEANSRAPAEKAIV